MSEWYKIFKNGPVLTHSPEEMRELGRQIGKILMPGEVLGVVGELGAGKTHLTQGIMEGLGSSDAAASPTFSLVHEHVDGDAVLIVEWANLFPDALPEGTSWLLLEHEGECLRRVSLAPVE